MQVKSKGETRNFGETLDLQPEDLVQYGLIPEFVGRLLIIATLEELDAEALIRILTEPRNALTKQYAKMFEMEGVEIDFREDGLQAVAERAMERKTGARGLRSILEGILLESMYTFRPLPMSQKLLSTNQSSKIQNRSWSTRPQCRCGRRRRIKFVPVRAASSIHLDPLWVLICVRGPLKGRAEPPYWRMNGVNDD